MSFTEELKSWFSSPSAAASAPPKVGEKAPSSDKLALPSSDGKPMVISFLRHCGCPFAEKTFITLRNAASKNTAVHYIAVSHSSEAHTTQWLSEVGGAGSVQVIVDPERTLYSAWGLGASSFAHVLSPSALSEVWRLASSEGIKNRPTQSGSRWQISGSWAMDGQGVVKWGGVAETASEIPDVEAAAEAAVGH